MITQTIDISNVKKILKCCPHYDDIINSEVDYEDELSFDLIDWYKDLIFSCNADNEEEVKIIADIIENGTWNTEGTTECANDCKLIIDERTYYYHSECGTFNDKENNQNLPVIAEEKESINAILAQYITLGLE